MSGDGWSDREEFWFDHDIVQDKLYLNPIFAEGVLYRAHNLMRDFKSLTWRRTKMSGKKIITHGYLNTLI
jgi:hypothetical protein